MTLKFINYPKTGFWLHIGLLYFGITVRSNFTRYRRCWFGREWRSTQ